jgi:ribose-phosphate pyrophosphokinase
MIKLYRDERVETPYKKWKFPGGEIGVKIDLPYAPTGFLIVAGIENSDEIIELGLLKRAMDDMGTRHVMLSLRYVPYSRQDRVCEKGESLSLAFFADYINMLNFDEVLLLDPHSDVSSALFRRSISISQFDIIRKFQELHGFIMQTDCFFVSPDAGANKKVFKLAEYFQHPTFIRADKIRSTSTGEIKEIIVYHDDFKGKKVIIFDDICDGGATFINLAKELKKKNCGDIMLYVTHGIFSRGLEVLFDAGITKIFTTDSRCPLISLSEKLIIHNL